MIEMLVEFGANIYARDQYERKPVDYTKPGTAAADCLKFYESGLKVITGSSHLQLMWYFMFAMVEHILLISYL